jgi:hypothetical protein
MVTRVIAALALSLAASPAFAGALPGKAAYLVTGTVLSATPACPHANGLKVSGYAAWPGIDESGFKKGYGTNGKLIIVFSDGAAIRKVIYALGPDDSFQSPWVSAKGSLGATIPDTQKSVGGTWSGAFTYVGTEKFELTAKLVFPGTIKNPEIASTCVIDYDLSFIKGVPAKVLNLL